VSDFRQTNYDESIASGRFFEADFTATVKAAGNRARQATLQAGVPVFYWDFARNLDVMEEPDGRRYEIRFVPAAAGEQNFQVGVNPETETQKKTHMKFDGKTYESKTAAQETSEA
jgi:hypothetical protein